MHTVLIGCTGISAKLSKPQSSKYDVMLKTTRRRSWERISLPNELLGSHALATTPLFETFLKCHVGTVPGHTFGKFGVHIAFGIWLIGPLHTDTDTAERHRTKTIYPSFTPPFNWRRKLLKIWFLNSADLKARGYAYAKIEYVSVRTRIFQYDTFLSVR